MDQLRFLPDTWADALLRFFAMAAPDANVYVEIPAPDLRFAAIALLAIGVLVAWRFTRVPRRGTLALLAFVLVCTPVWLLTTGNGRYFLAVLLIAGPLAMGLVCLLPLPRRMQALLVVGLLAGQVFVLQQQPPWDAWAWARWGDRGYFAVEVPPPPADGRPVTYVTVSSITYSLIAPQFPPESRWINITSVGLGRRDTQWAYDFLREAPGRIELLAPTLPGQMDAQGRPLPEARDAIDRLLAPHALALDPADACRFLRSAGMASIGRESELPPAKAAFIGFWSCALRYPVPVKPKEQDSEPLPRNTMEVLAKVEQMCPRFFQHGSSVMRISGGAMRLYPSADMKVYVFDDGNVMYKFWRALNPVLIGTVDTILNGTAKMDCSNIRGRSGLPWDREI